VPLRDVFVDFMAEKHDKPHKAAALAAFLISGARDRREG
jgi:hypothetical protein